MELLWLGIYFDVFCGDQPTQIWQSNHAEHPNYRLRGRQTMSANHPLGCEWDCNALVKIYKLLVEFKLLRMKRVWSRVLGTLSCGSVKLVFGGKS